MKVWVMIYLNLGIVIVIRREIIHVGWSKDGRERYGRRILKTGSSIDNLEWTLGKGVSL